MEVLRGFLSSFHFASPFFALGGLIVFLIFYLFLLRKKKAEKHSHLERVSDERLFSRIWQKLFFVLAFLLLVSLLLALAALQIVRKIEKPLEARDMVIVLDNSGSMMINFHPDDVDALPRFEKTRLGDAWQFTREFIKMRQGDRMAIILYDDPHGYIARGLTNDQEQLLSVFREEEIEGVYDSLPENDLLDSYAIHRGTNTPNALKLAEDYLGREGKSEIKLIILVTDLDDDPYGVPDALAKIRAKGIMVYTIGIVVGRSQERLDRLSSLFKDEGLRFFAVQNQEDWMPIINSIDQMEKSIVEVETLTVLKQVSWAFIGFTIFFAVVFMILSEKFKKVP